MGKKIVFIIHALSQPRCIKRVTALYRAGFECVVYGYNRGNYDVNTFPSDVRVITLGSMENGSNLKNFGTARRNLTSIINTEGKNCIYYTFGFLASMLISFKNVSFIYEISDVLYAYPKYDKVRFFMKWLDRRVIRRARNVVMTSGGFQKYFGVYDPKVIILPNKVSSTLRTFERMTLCDSNHPLRFAFIGAIRYDSIFRFAHSIGEHFPDYKFHFFGGAPEHTLQRVKSLVDSHSNIYYHGPFKSPDDLPKIYSEIDIVVACYDTNSLNERIAEPNKLYEAMMFCRPIVVSEGTYLAERVIKYGCGYTINPSSEEAIVTFISALNHEQLIAVSKNEQKINVNEIVDDASSLIESLTSETHHG